MPPRRGTFEGLVTPHAQHVAKRAPTGARSSFPVCPRLRLCQPWQLFLSYCTAIGIDSDLNTIDQQRGHKFV